jgi:hypothetical protein
MAAQALRRFLTVVMIHWRVAILSLVFINGSSVMCTANNKRSRTGGAGLTFSQNILRLVLAWFFSLLVVTSALDS